MIPDPPHIHPARLGDRTLFPDLGATAYLNHAAISPPSARVQAAVHAVVADYAAQGMSALHRWLAQRERLRARLAGLVGATAEDIALTGGTTVGIRQIAFSMDWRPGDRVILFQGEFPANITPWQQAAATFDLVPVFLPLDGFGDGSGDGLARLEAALAGGARLVAVSAVQFQTGLRMPLAAMRALCHAHSAELFVDGIQACGIVPITAGDYDYLSVGAHKWLMGLEGCGFLAIAPERVRGLTPRMAGWLSHEGATRFLFEGSGHLSYSRPVRQQADFLEGSAANAVGLAALEAAVTAIEEIGVQAAFTHVQAWHDLVAPAMAARGWRCLRAPDPGARSGILSFVPPAGIDATALPEQLGQRGVSCTLPDGRLRFAPHWPNSLAEVDVVLDAMDCLGPPG